MNKEGLEAFKLIKFNCGDFEDRNLYQKEYAIIEKELKDYSEIKEIAKHYHWDDLANDVFKVETDRKWQLKFESAICDVQEDYKKARVLDVLKRISHYDIHFLNYLLSEGKINQDEFNAMKEVLL